MNLAEDKRSVREVYETLTPQQQHAFLTMIHFKNHYSEEEYSLVRDIFFRDMGLTYTQFIACEYLLYVN